MDIKDWITNLDDCATQGFYFEIPSEDAADLRDYIKRLMEINERLAGLLNGEQVVVPVGEPWSHIYGTEGD